MSWEKLSERIDRLPLVLAGPMLRKVTPDGVTVWLALKDPAKVTLSIWDTDPPLTEMDFNGTQSTTRIGPNLHLVAVQATPAFGEPLLAHGQIYFYDLAFTAYPEDGSSSSSENLGLADAIGSDDETLLAYPPHSLPSFSLPPEDLNDLRLIQGSCRKPNAEGPDALAILDDLIAASAENAIGRPHQLLLTGDQIYADEVADVLLLMLTDAGSTLLGKEPLTHADGTQSLAEWLLPTTRSEWIKAAGYTSHDTRSHLMSLGEFLAMYLFVWSDVLWPPNVPTYDDLKTAILETIPPTVDGPYPPPSAESEADKALYKLKKLKKEIEIQRTNVLEWSATLPKVRRALANVPTYMVFDDHEVTDDWNMNREFCNKVYGDSLGKRLVQNALVAYSLCQHWGNAPEQFRTWSGYPAAGKKLLTLFKNASGGYEDIADLSDIATIVGLHTPAEHALKTPYAVYHEVGARSYLGDGVVVDTESLLFHYAIEGPGHQIIVTDSRTWRSFPRAGELSPGDLIAESQLVDQLDSARSIGDRLLMVVVSTNMPPSPAIRQGSRDLPGIDKKYAYEDFYDSWEVERVDFARMVAELSRKFTTNAEGVREGRAVLLSGDVHTSSASRLQLWADTQVGNTPGATDTAAKMVIAQLIGSSLHNPSEHTEGQHVTGYEYVPPKWQAKVAQQPVKLTEGFVGWNPRVVAKDDVLGTIRGYNIIRSLLNWLNPFYTVVSEYDWLFDPDEPTSTLRDEELPSIWEKRIVDITLAPHYRFRLDYLKAAAGSKYTNEDPVVEGENLERWAKASRKYERYAKGGDRRQMIGKANIGEIKFDSTLDTSGLSLEVKYIVRRVKYTVRWREGTTTHWVRYDVRMGLDDNGYEPIRHPSEP